MNYTLIRIVDASTDWNPAFALKAESGHIKTKFPGAKGIDQHWRRPNHVFEDMAREDPYCHIIWEGTTF